ncbi:SMC-Scp complex subunit ScpB [Candidatus Omnitrophota bacterium]
MNNAQKQNKEEINIKEIRKKIEAKIEGSLPEEFKTRHDHKTVEQVEVENMREVDEATAKRIIEALLFSSSKPVLLNEIRKVLRGYKPSKIEKLINELQSEYERDNRSFRIHEVAKGYELATTSEYYQWLKKLDLQKKGRGASFAALETLAVLAYKQPVTRGEIEDLRGVDVSGTLATLLERNFIKIIGRKEVPGRPLLYATTDFFLQHFGLKSLSDLPRIHEIKEIVEAAIKKETLVEQEKIAEQRKEQERQKELEKTEVEELARQRSEIKEQYEDIAGKIEGVKVMRPKQLSEIVNPETEDENKEENSEGESQMNSETQQEGAENNGTAEEEVTEYETKIIKTDVEAENESG